MSWGYFLDLHLATTATAWRRLASARACDTVLPAGWSGISEPDLEEAFGRPIGGEETFASILAWPAYHDEAVHERESLADTVTLRVCLLADKSRLALASPLAALLSAAALERSATGMLRIVNDGTSSGADGARVVLAKGKLSAGPIPRLDVVRTELATAVRERLAPASAPSTPTGRVIGINPRTGLPIYAGSAAPKKAAAPKKRRGKKKQ